ncbi:related to dipeptidyl aminopeptidases/acylaminoacyl-peptidases [Fusarium oxysporum]|uniref:Related to dipeptidyl aminopeptidases/acylaminoacyl-peptidases n=1 Tax=Fusarium oxysporum TaxID=5507 RepID=A0A2H3SWP2_FUSOX|nr:related to dipeptidyl aminopeptidases/acylaminoacyl-peptidases [Fusarium oxysporum]
MKTVAPYGTWVSPITAQAVASMARVFTCPRVNPQSGRAFFGETTPDGRKTIMEITKSGLRTVLPSEYSAENSVYGYGAAIFGILADDRIIFSNRDQTVCLLNPDSGEVTEVFGSPCLHYGSFSTTLSSPWILAVEEDRTDSTAEGTQNHVVAINSDTGEIKRVLTGADFYFQPRFNADGTRLSWTQYNRPELPYTDVKLHCADWSEDGTIKNARLVAGMDHESVAEPRWGPDGSLFFAKEVGSFRQLYRIPPDTLQHIPIELTDLEEAEFSFAGHVDSINTYTVLDKNHILATPLINGINRAISIEITTGKWKQLAKYENICQVPHDAVWRYDSTSALVIGAGTINGNSVYRIDTTACPESIEALRRSVDEYFPTNLFSQPQSIHIRSKRLPLRDIHGFLWMPRNSGYIAPQDARPPLIIEAHGGPTSHAGCGLSLPVQYFTSRGYAYLQANYAGSTGYGREYRQSLFGNWGVLETEDVIELSDYLLASGRVQLGAIGITGASAGGYTTLQVLSKYSKKFAGGVCLYGVTDLETLDMAIHKIEADIVPAFVLGYPPQRPTHKEELEVYHERSAIHHIKGITSPLLLIHGKEDTVVPIAQARRVYQALEHHGADMELLEIPAEGHMLWKPATVQITIEEKDNWWRKTLLKCV